MLTDYGSWNSVVVERDAFENGINRLPQSAPKWFVHRQGARKMGMHIRAQLDSLSSGECRRQGYWVSGDERDVRPSENTPWSSSFRFLEALTSPLPLAISSRALEVFS